MNEEYFIKGKYKIYPNKDGSHKIYGPGLRKISTRIPPEQQIIEMYHNDINTNGKLSNTTKKWFGELGIIHFGKRDNLRLRRHLGLNETWMSKEQIESAIREFWPENEIKKAQEYENTLKSINEFRNEYVKEYNAIQGKRFHNLRTFLENMIAPYSLAYSLISQKIKYQDIDKNALGNQLLDWFYQGRSIGPVTLRSSEKNSEEYNAYRKIICVKNNSSSILKTPLTTISELTGLDKKDISLSKKESKKSSIIAEKLISFMLHWAPILEMQINGIKGELHTSLKMNKFKYNEEIEAYSDLRVNNDAIEVKSHYGKFIGSRLENFLDKYGKEHCNLWNSGEPMENTYAFFLQPDLTYAEAKPKIIDAKIKLINQAQINRDLETIINKIKENPKLTTGLNPIPNFDYLLRLPNEIQGSCNIAKDSSESRNIWTKNMLNELIGRARKIFEKGYEPPENIEIPLKIQGARVLHRKKTPFLKIERPIEDIKAEPLKKYIKENKNNLTVNRIQKGLGLERPIKKRDILAWDLETAGLRYIDPIVSISYATFNGQEVIPGVLLARDYSEEKPMIEYFLEMVEDKLLLTYNGKSFDVPRLSFRAKHNGIVLNGDRKIPLEQKLNKTHIDLLPWTKKEFSHLSDKKLKTLERIIFNYNRGNDLPGSEIPKTYREWLGEKIETKNTRKKLKKKLTNKQKRERLAKKINGIVDHNLIDSITLIALLANLCKPDSKKTEF